MDIFWKWGLKDLPFVHHTALDLICSNKLPFDGRLLGWPTPFQTLEEECDDTLLAAVVEEAKLDGQRHFALTLLESVRIPKCWEPPKRFMTWDSVLLGKMVANRLDNTLLPLGAVRPMSLKPRTCSHCPIWASIMLNMACVRTRHKRPCELCTSLDWRNRSRNPSNGSLLWSAIVADFDWFCVLPVTCLPVCHTSTLPHCHFLQLWGGRFHATICLRPWGLLLRPTSLTMQLTMGHGHADAHQNYSKILGCWNPSSLSTEKPWFFTLTGLKCSKLQVQHAMELRTRVQQSGYYKGNSAFQKVKSKYRGLFGARHLLPFRWMVPEWVPKTREDLNLFYESMTIQPDFQQCIVLCIILHTAWGWYASPPLSKQEKPWLFYSGTFAS